MARKPVPNKLLVIERRAAKTIEVQIGPDEVVQAHKVIGVLQDAIKYPRNGLVEFSVGGKAYNLNRRDIKSVIFG